MGKMVTRTRHNSNNRYMPNDTDLAEVCLTCTQKECKKGICDKIKEMRRKNNGRERKGD